MDMPMVRRRKPSKTPGERGTACLPRFARLDMIRRRLPTETAEICLQPAGPTCILITPCDVFKTEEETKTLYHRRRR